MKQVDGMEYPLRVLKFFDESIATAIQIIFENFIREEIFPKKWKVSNVHKKE